MTTTTTPMQTPTLPEALAEFSHGELADDLAPRLNCGEVDALAGLLRAFERDEAADLWITEHATDDDEGDAHHPEGE
ncbi:hypothetical protein [Rathayibacter festucae]|uniref:hypothetical protein n=1 Tax=Rathayibacter festucae TaxID=110937 RepID=UPI002A6A5C1A|nr:hypothetical protein [Rathayibacter festucae]MDY0915029.1 hypothetical protein [Rathayibacter festucae]